MKQKKKKKKKNYTLAQETMLTRRRTAT